MELANVYFAQNLFAFTEPSTKTAIRLTAVDTFIKGLCAYWTIDVMRTTGDEWGGVSKLGHVLMSPEHENFWLMAYIRCARHARRHN